MTIQARLDEAMSRLNQGKVNEAIAAYTQILAVVPRQPDALYMLGALAFKLGQNEQAHAFAQTLTSSAPKEARGWSLKALALRSLNRAEEAISSARQALALDPKLPEAWECAGLALMKLARRREARETFEKALEFFPDHALLRANYALVLAMSEDADLAKAWEECQRALAKDPENSTALVARTTILVNAGYYDLALPFYRAAIGKYPGIRKTLNFGAGAAALVIGEFDEGYKSMAEAKLAESAQKSLPAWQGESGGRVVLFGEQGYGDTLQFIRFARRAAQRTQIVAHIPAPLERLIRASLPDLPLSVYKPVTIDMKATAGPIDPLFDFPKDANARCSFLNLPNALRLGGETDIGLVPYLQAPKELAAGWQDRLANVPHPRVGLVWAGNPQHGNNHNRSIAFAELAPLVEKFRPHLVSMQVGPEREEARAAGLFDATPFIADFADSAAALNEIDVLLTVDTAPAHLAGGLGRAAFVMIPFNPDWRWLLGREDSIWYPSLRLFRQTKPGDWPGVIAKLCAELQKLKDGDRSVLKPAAWQGGFLQRHPQALSLAGITG